MSAYSKSLLLCPKRYSLFNTFTETLKVISDEVVGLDVSARIAARDKKINTQIFRLPFKLRSKWESYFLNKVNKIILEDFEKHKPDLVFVYNSEFLLPETCEYIKKKAKLIFFLGDSPFYTPTNNYYLSLLQHADLILSPDSFWLEQLNMTGIMKTCFFLPSIDHSSYFQLKADSIGKEIHETDILYVGNSYLDSWGYKKALLMNHFVNYDFELYGNPAWKRWFKFFPELEKKYTGVDHILTEKLNKMFNKAKIIPVDGNPGIINGIHARALEALGSGALPLIEYRKDLDNIIFKGFGSELPFIQNYSKAKDIAQYYLSHDTERKDLTVKMKDFINAKYNPKDNAALILDNINAKGK